MAESTGVPEPPAETRFDKVVRIATYLYLLRVPFLIAVFMWVLPFSALRQKSSLVQLLQNLFWLDRLNTFWFTVIALALSWSLIITGALVLLNAQRFSLPHVKAETISWWAPFIVVLIAAPIVLGPFTQYEAFGYDGYELAIRALIVLAGFIVAYLLMFCALWGAILLAPRGTQERTAKQFFARPTMRNWLSWADGRDVLPTWITKFAKWFRDYFPASIWDGYLHPTTGIPWAGHWLAFWFFLATSSLYMGINIYRKAYLGEASPVPAIAYLLLLLVNVNWVLAFLTFFLDRFRIPLIVPLLILCALGTRAPSSDHYYGVQRGISIQPIRPDQVISARMEKGLPIVLVAAAGGGIQAAAWTTQVLAGLEGQTQQWKTKNFSDSVSLISSVSGGAVGSMYYLNLFHPDSATLFESARLNGIMPMAARSSLDDIGWALVYRDLRRLFFPYLDLSSEEQLLDRGFMLEESWRNRGNIQANLSNWRVGVAEGIRPAAIFNATIAETGEPLVLSTTEMKTGGAGDLLARRSFYDLYPNTDLAVVTAVRLSSTFPYVSPATRQLSNKPEHHVVDGGYYDGYGISSLVTWLDEAFTKMVREKKSLPPVLIIQIRAFPNEPVPPPTNKGWFFQSYAPINALMGVRTTGQLVRGQEELKLFAEKWASSSAKVSIVSFDFQGQNAPLSWSMNPKQQTEIIDQWKQLAIDSNPELLKVRCFFDPKNKECQKQTP
jgi:hypothetical protein